jgi:hypothetical protein
MIATIVAARYTMTSARKRIPGYSSTSITPTRATITSAGEDERGPSHAALLTL